MYMLEVNNLKKVYVPRFGGGKVEALKNVTFKVDAGEYVAVMGESGSGKTTLLNILAALDKPTGGSVVLDGRELSAVGDAALAAFRRDNLGFQPARHADRGGQYLPAAGAGGEEVQGDERADAPCGRTPRHHRHPQKVSL